MSEMRFYTGSYTRMGGKGISLCRLEDGEISCITSLRDINDPIYVILSDDEKTLFSVGSDASGEGVAASYDVQKDNIVQTSVQYTGGRVPCHLTLSRDERFLYTANYISGSISIFPLEQGGLGECVQVINHEGSGTHPVRQEAPHVHQCVFRPGTDELFACDLGTDEIVVYLQDQNDGKLSLLHKIRMPAGMGPRHLVFDGKDRFYVTGELDNFVRYFVCDDGIWSMKDELYLLPEDFKGESFSSAIRLADGKLYVTNRGHDSACVLNLNEEGKMEYAQWISSCGEFPRDMVIVRGEILFANQNSGSITTPQGVSLKMDGVVCICPVNK